MSEKKASPQTALFGLALIFIGCIANNYILEILVRLDSGVGNLMTLLQFLAISFETFFLCFDFEKIRLRERTTPFRVYVGMTVIFFSLSIINNMVFKFQISQPLHMVVRSSSLISTLILGFLFFNKSYSKQQVGAVTSLSIGIVIVTMAEAQVKQAKLKECATCGNSGVQNFQEWMFGVALLFVALFLSSLLGHLQEWSYKTYSNNKKPAWQEGLFYSHFLGLPYFLLFLDDIKKHAEIANQSELLHLFGVINVPSIWYYLVLNVVTQMVCIHGVYILTGAAGTLTCTLAITLRKFVSLVISIILFNNPFTLYHWIGSTLVFIGGSLYAFPLSTKAEEDKKNK